MKSKAKHLLPIVVVGLLILPFLGCNTLKPLVAPPALNSSQAIAIIQVVGLPYIDDYYVKTVGEEEAQATGEIGYVTPTGQWTADYKGNGVWIIRGPIVTETWGECSTMWTLKEKQIAKISLVGFECD